MSVFWLLLAFNLFKIAVFWVFFVRLVGRPGANSDGALARDEKTIKNMGSSGQPAQL
jgi:hypothetical protein